MNQTRLLLLSIRCDAPFRLLFAIQQLRRSLPRAKRRVALLYCNNSIRQLLQSPAPKRSEGFGNSIRQELN